MNMMLVILNDHDAETVLRELVEQEFRATRIASTGAFLRKGNTTLLIGLEQDKIDEVLEIIRDQSAEPEDPGRRRATVFVLPVSQFEQI